MKYLLLFLLLVGVLFGQPSNVSLPFNVSGNQALIALGTKLPDVANAYGLSSQKLTDMLRLSKELHVDKKGALLYVCENIVSPGPGVIDINLNGGVGGIDAFQLASLPGASRLIYLDFDGHVTSGTSWNSSYGGGFDIISGAFDLDGNPSSFSDVEKNMIKRIWQRVAEDYAPFNVNVTTIEPPLAVLKGSGIRVVISPSNWYGAHAGGVAYIGSFNWTSDTPCYAFTAQLANGEKYIAECISHEVGHTVGLYHDGYSTSTEYKEYYEGHGVWAPIMGNSYYKNVTQFSLGQYTGASNKQDDLAVISGYLPVLVDDHGNTMSTSSVIGGSVVKTGGTIERGGDVDMFKFVTGTGTISFNIVSPSVSPNLHLYCELLAFDGSIVVKSDLSLMSTSFNVVVTSGTYYLRVAAVGAIDYSSYGSLGDYIITGSLIPTDVILNRSPIAIANGSPLTGVAPLVLSFDGSQSYDSDGTITGYHWNFADGTTSNMIAGTKVFGNPGVYNVVLTVFDNSGDIGTDEYTVNVQKYMVVHSFVVSRVVSGRDRLALTTIVITDETGIPVKDVRVGVSWSGIVKGSGFGLTDQSGQVTISTNKTKRSGPITITITDVTHVNYVIVGDKPTQTISL